MTTPIPASGYPSNTSRTQSDMMTYFETMLSITKEQLGGTSEAASVALASNTFTPGNNACVCVIDTNGMGATDTLNNIQVTNMRDGEVLFLRSTNSSRVITIANAASGTGQIYTSDGNSVVLNNTKLFIALKYNASISAFEEMFRTLANTNWSSPGPIGSTTPNTGSFTSLSLTGTVAAHKWLGNSGSSAAAPTFATLGTADLPASVVATAGNLAPLFSTSIASQNLAFSLSNASAGSLFGNFTGSSAAPSFVAPGAADQLLGVAHTGGGLEYKSLVAGSNITITAAAGSITIASSGSGGFSNPMTTLGDMIYENSSPAAARLSGNTTTTKMYLSQTGAGGGVSAAPVWAQPAFADLSGSAATSQLPASVVTSVGNLSPLFTASIASQALSFSPATVPAHSAFGNFSGATAAPTFGTVDVGSGGTGATTLAGSGALVMNSGGTAATSVAPGASGNFLASNGTTWSSLPPSISLTTGVTGVLPIANGGTNATSLAANGVIVSNSSGSALSSIAPSTSGNVLTSNGTSWVSAVPTGGSSGFTVLDVISYTFCGGL